MIRATSVEAAGAWKGEPADVVVLEFDDRHRRRFAMKGVKGLEFLLDLEEAVALRTGDGLRLENGFIVEVVGKPESLMEVKTKNPDDIVRIAWHLGNRHLPVQIVGKKLRLREDHVIADMLKGLGVAVASIEAPFDPEGGAYVQTPHGHDHGHHHDHHDHAHDHGASCCGGHGHDHAHHDHKHGDDCCGGHGHKHEAHGHHDHDHKSDHGHDHGHHQHGPGCGCGHHGHKHD